MRGISLYLPNRDVDKGGAGGATAPPPLPLGSIFVLKHFKKEAKLGRNGQKMSIRTPPPEGESKNPHPP